MTIVPLLPSASNVARGTGPSEPAMVVTQSVALRGRPFYLGKHMILSHAGQLSVLQAGP